MTNLAKLSIREIQQIHAISGKFFLEHGIDPETMGHLTPVELCLLEEFNLAQLIRAMKKKLPMNGQNLQTFLPGHLISLPAISRPLTIR